jgi:hypothetical protein
VEIHQQNVQLAQIIYPRLTPRRLSSQINHDLYQLYLTRINGTRPATMPQPETFSDDSDASPEQPKDIADRIASKAPHIDDTNWAILKRNITTAADRWNQGTELLLLEALNEPFDEARNEKRVQNQRIRAFFERHLS